MSIYLNASVLVALFTNNPLTVRAETFLRANPLVLFVSDFGAAEFSSVIARHVQTKDIRKDDARIVFSNFDTWTSRATQRARIRATDIIVAEILLRRLDLALRTPDAINIAMARRMGVTLVTFKRWLRPPVPSEPQSRKRNLQRFHMQIFANGPNVRRETVKK